MIVESFNEFNLKEALSFLMDYENFSLFLLGNLEANGYKLTSSPNSGNFKLIRHEAKIVAVFSLTRRGNLVVQSSLNDNWVMEAILDACKNESLPILGLIGEWLFCQKFWSLLKEKKIIEKELFISKEILYTTNPEKQCYFNSVDTRLLTAFDFSAWRSHRISYLAEAGLPNDLSQEQMEELFLEKVKHQIIWGCFKNGELASTAELNAKAKNLGQVGGVYTLPTYRKKGFAKELMCSLLRDCYHLHKLRKIIIFTGETNYPARKLYESLYVNFSGYYALMFGSNLL